MQNPDAKKLIAHIKDCFLHEERYQMHRTIAEFKEGDKFLGDYFQFVIYEPNPVAPIIYSTGGPFDLVTHKAPDRAQAFQDGKLILDIDFFEWTKIRTGAMDALMMNLLSKTHDSKILYYGAGGSAEWSLRILKQLYPLVETIDYHNASGGKAAFEGVGQSIGIVANYVDHTELKKYDCIFMHTDTEDVILKQDSIKHLKPGALLNTYISSTIHGEVADEFYNDDANVILDWNQNLDNAKDLKRAVEAGYLPKDHIIYIQDLLKGKKPESKSYTIARFCGTPIQNLAVLHYLQENSSAAR